MYRTKTRTALLGLSLTAIANVWMGLPTPTLANSISVKPPVVGAPGGRVPGGSRDPNCLGVKPLMALIPASSVGNTTAQYPTFLLSIPSGTPKSATFTLQDEHRKQVYKTTVSLRGKPGITSFQLPAGASPGLQIGKNYRWFFSVACNTDVPDQSGDPFVQGWIQRTQLNPTLARQLQQVAGRDRVALYQNAGLWYDALATLAQLRRSNPQDAGLRTTWLSLLNSAGLNQVAAEPLL